MKLMNRLNLALVALLLPTTLLHAENFQSDVVVTSLSLGTRNLFTLTRGISAQGVPWASVDQYQETPGDFLTRVGNFDALLASVGIRNPLDVIASPESAQVAFFVLSELGYVYRVWFDGKWNINILLARRIPQGEYQNLVHTLQTPHLIASRYPLNYFNTLGFRRARMSPCGQVEIELKQSGGAEFDYVSRPVEYLTFSPYGPVHTKNESTCKGR